MGTEKELIKVLVTGGGGFVGIALVRRLVKSGFEVASFSRNIYEEHKELGVKSIQGDIVNQKDVEKACKGIELVFHVAAKVGIWGAYKKFYEINVVGTENVISACLKNGVKKLIFTCSASVVFDGTDLINVDESIGYPQKHVLHYTATKAEAEQLVLNANSTDLKTISLRPHLIWGPGDTQLIPKILQRVKSGRFRRIGKKDVLIDTVYVDNLIDAQLLAMEKIGQNPDVTGKAFFITNGDPILVWDFLNTIIRSAGLPPVKKSIPKIVVWIIAWILEKFHLLFRLEKEPFITRFILQELCTSHWFNISAAKNLLGYSPKVNLKGGILKLK